ncbi:MoxR-like ATPases [hydrothermal vent metagenome]|uniref:MoxR-like ATPases n=1 Tax=hydrothermal vent metagenome TaxID=652676 RepID=A0A1W1CR45_9ZZZZ
MKTDKKAWRIYEGTKKLKDIEDTIPQWRDKKKINHNANSFLPLNDEIIDAVNTAIYLRRPLLVTGEPGIGKSSLAKSIAKKLDIKLLHWQITSKSVLKDALYSYDALSRLHDIQMKKLYFEMGDKNYEVKQYANISTGIENYLKLKSLGSAFLSKETVVVLIDEIDKSDIDLPNDLLHIFEEQEFEIDELKRMKYEEDDEPNIESELIIKDSKKYQSYQIPNGKVICNKFPIIVMTSNNEREFPPAFLRRCISVEMKLSNDKSEKIEQLSNMVKNHFKDEKDDDRIEKIVESFVELKEKGLRSNDQLLNAVHLVLKSNLDYETFKDNFESIVSKELDN